MTVDDSNWIASRSDLVLVTGANGFLGLKVVETLLKWGFLRLRCLVRSEKNIERLQVLVAQSMAKVEILHGNLLSRDDCRSAVREAAVILHLAAGTGKSFAGCVLDSGVATRNLLDAAFEAKALKRFLSLSSLAVHSGWDARAGSLLDENSPIERDHMKRFDPYAYGKIKQDEIVLAYGRERGIPYTILRPGPVYGPGKSTLTGRAGTDTFGVFIALGGPNRLPLVFIDNCAEAVVLAALARESEGEVLICVDDDLPTGAGFLRLYKKNVGWFFSVRLPYSAFYFLNWLWEKYSNWSEGQLPPAFNRRQCAAYYKRRVYSNDKLKTRTGWRPRVPFSEACERYFEYVKANRVSP